MMKNLFKGTVERRQVEKLRKAVNKFIEKNNLEICTLTREEMYDIANLKITNDIIIDYVLRLPEDDVRISEGADLHKELRGHIFNVHHEIVKAPKYTSAFKRNAFISVFGTVSMLFCIIVMIIYGFDIAALVNVILGAFLVVCAGIGAREEVR